MMRFFRTRLAACGFLLVLSTFTFCQVAVAGEQERWWPVQRTPAVVVRVADSPSFGVRMMVQSAAGLAAKAVNQSRGNELVWVGEGNPSLEQWLQRFLQANPKLEPPRQFGPWELVNRSAKTGLIKGFILYREDRSSGALNEHRKEIDCSVNVATSLAGILDGVIVSEELRTEAEAHGLKLLLDVRDKTESWCFETYKQQFNQRLLCAQDPKKPHVRDLAVAQGAFTLYSEGKWVESVMAWLEPLSPILGWLGGDEFEATDLSTRYGQIQTATDWCMNLPLLMAGSENREVPRIKSLDPAKMDWNDRRTGVSFVGTDGDNVQWLQGNFFHHPSYWANPARGKIPYGWSSCFAHLAQLVPQAIEYAAATKSTNDSLIEWGGGYYYPDRFALSRTNRWDLLSLHARRTWAQMKRTDTRVIGFNFARWDSPDARRACEVFARETDGLLGILAFQYSPYEAGAGRIFWVQDGQGIDVPVVSARYSIWEHANREHSGTPAKIARTIRETQANSGSTARYDWVINHVWSYFKKAAGTGEAAEEIRQENAEAKGGQRGYTSALWCAERLPENIRVINPEEMLWRIRKQHNPMQTEKFIQSFR